MSIPQCIMFKDDKIIDFSSIKTDWEIVDLGPGEPGTMSSYFNNTTSVVTAKNLEKYNVTKYRPFFLSTRFKSIKDMSTLPDDAKYESNQYLENYGFRVPTTGYTESKYYNRSMCFAFENKFVFRFEPYTVGKLNKQYSYKLVQNKGGVKSVNDWHTWTVSYNGNPDDINNCKFYLDNELINISKMNWNVYEYDYISLGNQFGYEYDGIIFKRNMWGYWQYCITAYDEEYNSGIGENYWIKAMLESMSLSVDYLGKDTNAPFKYKIKFNNNNDYSSNVVNYVALFL